MGCLFFFDCLVGLIILICIDAPWWAWVLYAVSAVIGFFVWAAQDSDSGDKKSGGTKQE